MESTQIHDILLRRLNDVRRKENSTELLSGVFFALLIIVAAITLVLGTEELFHTGTVVRIVLFYALYAAIIGTLVWYVGKPLLQSLGVLKNKTEEEFADQVGSYFPSVKDNLHNALQLIRERQKANYSTDLIDASLLDLYNVVSPLDFSTSVDSSRLKKIRKKFMYGVGVAAVVLFVSPTGYFTAFERVMHYNKNFDSPVAFLFHIEPGNKEVVRGESVPVKISIERQGISFSGSTMQTLTLFKRTQGQVNYETQVLKAGNDGYFTTEFSLVKMPLWYYAEFQETKSDEFAIAVVDKPIIRNFSVKVTPPRYTKLPEKELDENSGDISAYKGTKLSFTLTSSKELANANLVFSDSSKLPFTINGKQAECSFTVATEKNYHVELVDNSRLTNPDPIQYHLNVIPDEYPTASISTPGKNVDADQTMKLDMVFDLKDDFGFSKLRLAHKLIHSKYEPAANDYSFDEITLSPNAPANVALPYQWDFSALHLAPEDVIQYYIEVFDNDNISGPKSGKSAMYLLRLPSLEEVLTEANKQQNQTVESLSSASQEAQQLHKELEKLQQEMKKHPNKMDWLQKKKTEELAKKYEDVQKKVSDASKQLDQMMQQMDQHQLLSEQTMQKYEELQKLMKDLDSPEFRELLKKLSPEQKPLTPEQMKDAMKNLSFNEEQFRKALERMMELMKRIAMEQKLDELIKKTEEAIKQQKELKEQTKNADKQNASQLSKKQDDVKQQTDKLQQEAKELGEKMKELSEEMPVDKMEQANKNLQQSNPQQKMSNAKKQMQSGQMSDAQQSQQQSEQSLEQFEKDLKDAQKEMRSKQQEQIVKEMKKQLDNALELSKQQEQTKNETQQLEFNSPKFPDEAGKQSEMLNNAEDIANALAQIGKKSFAVTPEMGKAIGDAMQKMQEAMNGLESRNGQNAAMQQAEAMGSLNRAAAMLSQSMQGMQGSGGSGMGMQGMMQALGQMASQQQGINQGTQGSMGQGGGLTQEQAAAMSRLAQEQGGLGKSMDELANEAKQTDDMSKILGDLKNISKEMQEVATDMQQGNVNPETLRKQDRILSRLLDSQRSMRERDFEKRRKAEQGKTSAKNSPAELDPNSLEGKNKLQQDLLKALQEKYSKDYETLIRKYFEALQNSEKPN